MIRRLALLFVIASLLLPACREERPRPELSPRDKELLQEKADEKISIIITENRPALFAGVVVFESDAFLTQSHRLDRAGLSVLNMFGNAAILLLNSPDIPPLLAEPSVKKIYYLCRQGALARLHPSFEMEMLRRFGDGKADEPFAMLIRFRDPPAETERSFLEGAGFKIQSETGYVWGVSGPPKYLYRLFEDDRIIFYEGASKVRTM